MEIFRQGDKDVRWYVMADDDNVLFIDNLVEVLAKYDHTEYFYIGTNSECVSSNIIFSFEMAFGGAGYALSYPLVEALSTKVGGRVQQYPNYSSDFILQACLADFGVALTHRRGFLQIDLHGDISGLLSAHPQSPILFLHLHEPLCVHKPSATEGKTPFFMLNTRSLTNDPCETPHEFFLESVEKTRGNQVVTTYVRSSPRNVPPCSSNDNHSADHMSKIEVFSSSTTIKQAGLMECCDVEETADMNIAHIKSRACMKNAIIA
ncbi:hypothetical protein H0E87_017766 [Populus deltoides]|nr:hypothetical protein H0E87_017766 [Populus deltoides]